MSAARLDVVEHARLGVEDLVLILREILGEHVVAELDRAGGGRFRAGEQLDERGFARAVDADQRHAVAALDGEADVVEDALFAVALGQASASTTVRPEGGGCGNLKWMTGSSSGISMRSIFSSSLMRLCTCLALVAWARKRLMKASRCSICSRWLRYAACELRAALVFLREIFGVVALVDGEALVPDLDGAVDGDVEEIAVVGDEDVAEGIVLEVVLKPVAGFEIEMVGGLVEKQQIGLGEQQFGQRDAHLPAAGELIGLARPVFFAEAEAGEHGAHLRVERVAVEGVEALLQHGVALGGGCVFRARRGRARPAGRRGARSRASMARISSKTVRHSSKTVRPVRRRPSCGR